VLLKIVSAQDHHRSIARKKHRLQWYTSSSHRFRKTIIHLARNETCSSLLLQVPVIGQGDFPPCRFLARTTPNIIHPCIPWPCQGTQTNLEGQWYTPSISYYNVQYRKQYAPLIVHLKSIWHKSLCHTFPYICLSQIQTDMSRFWVPEHYEHRGGTTEKGLLVNLLDSTKKKPYPTGTKKDSYIRIF
jgi:hypothetical protein